MEDLFPFDNYRQGQDSFIKVINTAIKHKKNVLAQVPTGVGKTVSALSPCLKYALENKKHVIFLTSKHTHHKIAIETLRLIKEKRKINFIVSDFIGKRWMCPREDIGSLNAREFLDFCRYVVENKECNFYNNFHNKERIFTNKLLMDDLKNEIYHVDELTEKCKNAEVCAFEAAALVAKQANVVIADYFHVLNSVTRNAFFKKINKELNDCIIIWDEAHNLPSRARDLMSDVLSTISLDGCIREANKFNQDLENEIVKIKNKLIKLSDKLGLERKETLVKKEDFYVASDKLLIEIEKTAEKVIAQEKRSYLNSLVGFLHTWKQDDEGFSRIFRRTFNRTGKPVLSLFYNCLDPSVAMKPILENTHSNIFMSGTLYPLDMYEEILGLKNAIKVEYPNPFPKENRLDIIVPAVSTKFSERSEIMFERMADILNELNDLIKGNKIMFFPSYDIVEKVKKNIQGKNIFIEEPGMDKYSRELILKKFIACKKEGAVLIAVSAGSFGESIDLIGDNLKAVFIVGVPFPKKDLDSEELIRYYEEKFGKGLDYGYIMPAFTNILQNAGRCIRSENDKGVIVYLDSRYMFPNYRKYFPSSVELKAVKNFDDIKDLLLEMKF